MKLDYGCGEVEAIFSVETMMVYEQEFGADIVQELFGRAVVRREESADDVLLAIDYRNVNWTKCVKVLWAAMKTADQSLPPFSQWVKDAGPIDLGTVADRVLSEATKGFFRAGAGDTD